MDGSHFDSWTRRGFGAAAGGLAGSLLALAALPVAEARKKKKKKKCGKLGDTCNDGSQKCCCGFNCPSVEISLGRRSCCRAPGFPVSSAQECCSGLSQLGECICKTLGQPCGANQHCCSSQCGGDNKCTTAL